MEGDSLANGGHQVSRIFGPGPGPGPEEPQIQTAGLFVTQCTRRLFDVLSRGLLIHLTRELRW